MPYIRHHALLIVGDHDGDGLLAPIEVIREQLSEDQARFLLGPVEGINMDVTYVLVPDNSGRGWGTAREFDLLRERLKAAGVAAGYDVVHLSFGGDEPHTTAEYTTDDGITVPNPFSLDSRPDQSEYARALNASVWASDPLLVDPYLGFHDAEVVLSATPIRRILTSTTQGRDLERIYRDMESYGTSGDIRVTGESMGGRFLVGSADDDAVVVLGGEGEWRARFSIGRLTGLTADALRDRLQALWDTAQPADEWLSQQSDDEADSLTSEANTLVSGASELQLPAGLLRTVSTLEGIFRSRHITRGQARAIRRLLVALDDHEPLQQQMEAFLDKWTRLRDPRGPT